MPKGGESLKCADCDYVRNFLPPFTVIHNVFLGNWRPIPPQKAQNSNPWDWGSCRVPFLWLGNVKVRIDILLFEISVIALNCVLASNH